MEASRVEVAGIGIEEELPIPGFVRRNHSAHRLNERLLQEGLLSPTQEADLRHNGELDRDANPDDWVDPVSAKKIFENWNRSIEAVPLIERLEATGQLNPAVVDKKPEWLKEEEIHEALLALAESILGDAEEVGTVHPISRVRLRIDAEQAPTKRLAIVFEDIEEERTDDADIISRRAFVYNRNGDAGTFGCQRIYREILRSQGRTRGEPEGAVSSDIQREEDPSELIDLVSILRVLAESDVIQLDQPDA